MSTRRPFIAGNWKMHTTPAEAVRLIEELAVLLEGANGADVCVAPPFICLPAAHAAVLKTGERFLLGAQNVHWESAGAFTGEVSAAMLKAVGCRIAIVGHSERRRHFAETDQAVHRRLAAALSAGLSAILCVGERLEEREAGQTREVVTRQLNAALEGLAAADLARLTVAYEPVWAIGTGRTATPEAAQQVHAHIRSLAAERFGGPAAEGLRILYGGSVKPENIDGLMACPDVDGALVGGASLNARDFARIVRFRS